MNELMLKSGAVLAAGYGKHRPAVHIPRVPHCADCGDEAAWPCPKARARSRRLQSLAALPEPPSMIDPAALPAAAGLVWQPDLTWYDWLIIESSGGKDSQAMLDVVCRLAAAQGVLDRVVVVHADLGKVEWDASVDLGEGWNGTADLAARQAAAYGVRFIVVRHKETLLAEIARRRKFPDAARRFCTSGQKRGPSRTLMTLLGDVLGLDRPVRILNCLGMRGQESCGRAKLNPFELDEATAVTKKWVWRWLPIHDWTIEQVWNRIRDAGTPVHPIYAKGLSRASCSFCVLASKPDLLLAIRLRPELAREYADLEADIGHDFRLKQPMRALIAEAGIDDEEPELSPDDLELLFDYVIGA